MQDRSTRDIAQTLWHFGGSSEIKAATRKNSVARIDCVCRHHWVETRHYRALVFPERLPPELQRVTNTTLFWDCDPSLQSWKLVEFRKVFSAAPIFHVRRRLARNRFASHACCAWRFTASACELDAVEQSSCHDNDNFRISGGILTPSHYRPVDAHRGNFGCVARNLADHHDSRRPMGNGFARNHWLRCRHVRTGSTFSRCSPVWVEARGTTAQNQPQLLKSSFINQKISGLKEAVSFPP